MIAGIELPYIWTILQMVYVKKNKQGYLLFVIKYESDEVTKQIVRYKKYLSCPVIPAWQHIEPLTFDRYVLPGHFFRLLCAHKND